ncbi:MAG: hypothetical protein J2O48_11575 [Solirubrobacterales bacterium]|nr:hypothetical protein [Solirubrobacterales bacterium]
MQRTVFVVFSFFCLLLVGTPAAGAHARYNNCNAANAVFKGRTPYVGISDAVVGTESAANMNCTLGRIAAAHLGLFRGALDWQLVEYPRSGTYNWGYYDTAIALMAKHRIRFLPGFLGTPSWDAAGNSKTGFNPPKASALPAFANFVTAAVKRYGPHGSFWTSHPNLPYLPVTSWQVWNEPNLPIFWAPKPNPKAYVQLLKTADQAVKRADRKATVVSAGTPFLSTGGAQTWLGPLLADGGARYMDALALHYYGGSMNTLKAILSRARHDLNAHGGRHKSLWITETGYAGGPPNVDRPSQAGQRNSANALFSMVSKNRKALNIAHVLWYGWVDHVQAQPANWWGNNLGLTMSWGAPKLALSTVSSWAARLDR